MNYIKNTYTKRELALLTASVRIALRNDFILLQYGAELRILLKKLLDEKERNENVAKK